MIVKQATYEVTDPDVSSQITSLKAAGVDTLMIFATPKFAIQSLVTAAQQNWKPQIYLTNVSGSQAVLRTAMKAAGPGAATGLISTGWVIDPADPDRFGKEPGYKLFMEIMTKYLPGANTLDSNYMAGMLYACMFVDTLKGRGKESDARQFNESLVRAQRKQPIRLSGHQGFDLGDESLPDHVAATHALQRNQVHSGGPRHRRALHHQGRITLVESLLAVRELTLRFSGITALDDVSFDVAAGSITGLIGAERRRQDHVFQLHHPLVRADVGSGAFQRRRPLQVVRTRDRPAQYRAHVPERRALRQHDGPRERARRRARPDGTERETTPVGA